MRMLIPEGILKYVRWFVWALMCSLVKPDFLSVDAWIDRPSTLVNSLVLYLLFGVVLEVVYRKLSKWGRPTRQGSTPVIPPELHVNPWIAIYDVQPPVNSSLEVFCCDGKIRNAISAGKIGKEVVLYVEYEKVIRARQQENPWVVRPMHWRRFK